MYVSVEIKGPINSRALWSLISRYNVSCTDLGKMTYVYGDVTFDEAVDVVSFCSMFGELKTEYGGEFDGKTGKKNPKTS